MNPNVHHISSEAGRWEKSPREGELGLSKASQTKSAFMRAITDHSRTKLLFFAKLSTRLKERKCDGSSDFQGKMPSCCQKSETPSRASDYALTRAPATVGQRRKKRTVRWRYHNQQLVHKVIRVVQILINISLFMNILMTLPVVGKEEKNMEFYCTFSNANLKYCY